MDFSRLPDDTFLKIFKYLQLEECIRIGSVNKTFRRISQYVTSQTTSLDLTENRFRKLTADHLAIILNLCSPNLKAIEIPNESPRGVQLATIFANYQCPQLSKIDLGCPRLLNIDLGVTPIDYAVFERLIRNNPNIASLDWRAEFVRFPVITNKNLKKLNLCVYNDAALQSLIGRFPNLSDLTLVMKNISVNDLDELFASMQQIQLVDLHLIDNQIVLEDLVSFWNLPLVSLTVTLEGGVIAEGGILQKVVTSFSHLQSLFMWVSNPSNHDIAALAALQELEDLVIISGPIDDGIGELIACKKLRKLRVSSFIITPATLIALLRGCPQLEHVLVHAVGEVETPEEAAVVLGSLSGIPKRGVEIKFSPNDHQEEHVLNFIWGSEVVKEVIRNLEQDEGLKVKIDWYKA